jgi:hypothetical protein
MGWHNPPLNQTRRSEAVLNLGGLAAGWLALRYVQRRLCP